jgi:hypothetical protein
MYKHKRHLNLSEVDKLREFHNTGFETAFESAGNDVKDG